MKTIVVALSSFLMISLVNAQLVDDFSDGNFTQMPEWNGNTELFEVLDGQLKLNDAEAIQNKAYLSLFAPTGSNASTTWEILIQLDFAPSTSNFALIYLAAQSSDLSTSPDGYYLKIGGIPGNEDAIEFFVRENGNDQILLSGTVGAVANDPTVRVRVTRSTTGNWQLFADYSGGNDFQLEGEAQDASFTSSNYFGIVCNYTSTRREAFRFDDVLIDPIQEDETPPSLLEAAAIDENQIRLVYNEPIEEASFNVSNFSIDQGIGIPQSARLNPENNTEVLLNLSSPLQSQQTYIVTAEAVQDLAGNVSATDTQSFTFVKFELAGLNDIIISEILADPSPTVGLPEFEFVELYNNSNKAIQLEGFGFSSGGSPKILTPFALLPGTYVILTDDEATNAYQSFGNVIPISSFPSLTNSRDELSLTDANGNTIFEVAYSSDWYQDESRENGGYTLEIINTDGPYNCAGNWRASITENGGTPGQVNSWLGQSPDQDGPILLKAVAISDAEVVLTFNEAIDESTAINSNFSIDNGIQVVEAMIIDDRAEVLLILDDELVKGAVYEITVQPDVTDCLGNNIGADVKLVFGLTERIEAGDLIINEVLFNPESGGEDFVEVYNISNKILNLRDLDVINTFKLSGNTQQRIETDFLVFPNSYAVITDEPNDIIARYETAPLAAFVANDLPTLDAREGNVTLSLQGEMIDAFDYSEDLHYPLLENEKGVSLERVSFLNPTNDSGNWHTAAATIGFATPGLENSQFFPVANMIDEVISIPEKKVSPDGDGFQDILLIQYETDQPGYLLNAKIFDIEGREVLNLLKNELLSNQGAFKWDGVTNEDSRARVGIYILWLELFDANGNVTRKKETIVVAGKFN